MVTRLASDAPTSVIVASWSLLAVVFTLWIGLPWHRTMRQQVASLVEIPDHLTIVNTPVDRVESELPKAR